MDILVFVIEDDKDINQMLTDLLKQNKYEVRSAFSGTEALLLLEKEKPDVVLLDLMLPGMNGEEVLRRMKAEEEAICVIAISAKGDQASKISVLRTGADDYMTKPFDTEELLARIEAVLRRNGRIRKQAKGILTYQEITLNKETMEVFVSGNLVPLTRREYGILELLMEKPNKVFTKNNIYESIWNEDYIAEDNVVNVHISNIRQKLAKAGAKETYIQTVWGIGFKMK